MISTSVLMGIEFVGFFGFLLWFGWSQARMMERSLAEAARRAEDDDAG
jgi:hypothetical protein